MSDALLQIESLVRALEAGGDVETRRKAQDLVRLLLEVHKDGLARVLAALRAAPGGDRACADLERDPLVSHLLLLHGLHPRPPAERVEAALEALRAEGHPATLSGVEDGVARIRVGDAPAGARVRIEEAVWSAAPDLEGVVLEGRDAPRGRGLPVVAPAGARA